MRRIPNRDQPGKKAASLNNLLIDGIHVSCFDPEEFNYRSTDPCARKNSYPEIIRAKIYIPSRAASLFRNRRLRSMEPSSLLATQTRRSPDIIVYLQI
jgi:hypothetical protein